MLTSCAVAERITELMRSLIFAININTRTLHNLYITVEIQIIFEYDERAHKAINMKEIY